MRLLWLGSAFAVALMLAAFQEWAFRGDVFYYYPWADTVPHTLGGVAVGALVIGLWPRHPRRMWYAFLVMCALVGWEAFENFFRAYELGQNYVLDTASDLLFGTLGSLLPYGVARLTVWKDAGKAISV